MGYLTNIINDARGSPLAATLATEPAMPLTEVPTSPDDGAAAAKHPMSSADSMSSEALVPMDEQKQLLAESDDRRHEDTIDPPTMTTSLRRDAGKQSSLESPPITALPSTPLPSTPLQAVHHDLFEIGELRGASQDEQQSMPVDDLQQELAAGQKSAQTPTYSLVDNEKRPYLERSVIPGTDQSQSRDVSAVGEHNIAQSPGVKNPEPAASREMDTAQITAVQAAVAVTQDETTPSQSEPEGVPTPPQPARVIMAEKRGAPRPTAMPPRTEPSVHIGRVDIVVVAPEPAATSRTDAKINNSDFASSHYLRGL